jgi:hypothetical protein
MDKEELFQSYLDNELAEEENQAVEELLKTNPEVNKLFQEMKTNRATILETLDLLNPTTVEIPSKIIHTKKSYKVFWRIAAMIIILIGISAVLWLSNRNLEGFKADDVIAEEASGEIISNELDYYISPNRCWVNRELVWTIIETK